MNTITSNRLVDNYYRFMRNWETDSKKELINKLKVSINLNSKAKSDFSSCFGAWEDSRSPDEIITEIRADRVNQTEVDSF